ncbi:hypothetical protein TRFO_13124 [Tritrichomonas foetus]|uniref:Importin N-terminal domain-containing protein n=1 Tax=Tritrichomonas foetus TaxID=1144522 RepID=A0A1J4KZ56_9EUKA|nr:hypothetical protein TRFO_13124 [Tritrichomonas foetus]|eukprot:OHT16535.1 hypothetical protein TRFO_13124 [Tritrichomonas foetus]
MNETELQLLSVLSAFSSPDNIVRSEAEKLYNELETKNPEKMVDCLSVIIKENKNTFEALAALIKLGEFIEASSIRSDCNLSDEKLNNVRIDFLNFLVDSTYPEVTRNYILSVLEDFIYITNGGESDWPELVPFFLSLLDTDDRPIALRFLTYYLIVNPTDDFNALIQPKIQLEAPNENDRATSLKLVLISLFSNPQYNSYIPQIPTVLASLNVETFSSTFSLFWKIFKKDEKLFSNIITDIIGLLLTNVADPSHEELFRRDSLFFFHKLFKYSKKCRKMVSKTLEVTIKIIASILQYPNLIPDLYEEAKIVLSDLVNDLVNDKALIENYTNDSNDYVSSFFISFFIDDELFDRFFEKTIKNVKSKNQFIHENGILTLRNCIAKNNSNREIGSELFKLIQTEEWKLYIETFCYWCQKAKSIDVEPFYKKIVDLVSSNDAYYYLYCASIICCRCRQNARFVLKKVMKRIEKSNNLTDFQLCIISNTYQYVNPIISQESFKHILPFCKGSLTLMNSTSFLEIMEFIGIKFVPFLDEIIPSLFSFSNHHENILSVIDCLEKIVSLFSTNLDPFLEKILCFSLTNGSCESVDIRLESITLINLLLQHNWENKIIYDSILKYVLVQITKEVSMNCLDSLLSIVILIIERKDASNEVLQSFLSYIPYIISKAVEFNSEEIFASAGSIFMIVLKKIPNDATPLFFQLQKLIPHYSVSPPGFLKNFSLLTWTDFVTFGPNEQTAQYLSEILNDLKFYSEKEGDEDFRKIAIICLYSYYTAVEKTDLEIETIFDIFHRVAKNEQENSLEIFEISVAAFSVILQKYVNEKIFLLRTKQLVELLPLKRANDESDTVYNVIFELALMCSKNSDLFDFFEPLKHILNEAIKNHYISEGAIDDISQKLIELGEAAPAELRMIVQ